MLDHAPGFLGRQVQAVFPQVAVFQTAVFAELLAVGQQGEQPRVAAHQTFPGIEDAVVAAFDEGAEVQRVAEQGGAVLLDVGLVDAQQGVAEHRRRAVQVGRRKNQHAAVRGNVAVPGGEFAAGRLRQVIQLQLVAQPARACREHALGVFVAEVGGAVERREGGAQLGGRIVRAVGREKEIVVIHIAAPAAELAGFVMPDGQPVRVIGQLLQTGGRGAGGQSGQAQAQRQTQAKNRPGGEAFAHGEGFDGASGAGKGRPVRVDGPRRIRLRWRTGPDGHPASSPPGWQRELRRRWRWPR